MADSKDLQSDDANLKRSVHTRIPTLGGDLARAIKTLKKLQKITGSLVVDPNSENTLPPGEFDDDIVGEVSAKSWRLLAAGEAFGRYQISRQIGKGAMGAVYLAYDPQLERYVALKTPFLGDDPNVIQRFLREARSAAQIRSPYVCAIYEINNVSGILYLSMAFIEGQTLTKWIRKHQYSLNDILAIFSKTCQGMQKAHAQNIIHRDLKPENIMIDTDQEPIIMDFGLARRVHDDSQFTSPGGILGTPAYMSPEQVKGDQSAIGPLSDQYSMGVVLYDMLTASVPFTGSVMSVLHQVVNDVPPPPSTRQPELPAGSPIEKMCLKMMAKNPQDRYQSISEVLSELEALAPTPKVSAPAPRLSPMKALFKKSAKALATIAGRSPQGETDASPPPDAMLETTAHQAAEDVGATSDSPLPTIDQPGEKS